MAWKCRKPRGAGGTPALPGEQNSVQQSVLTAVSQKPTRRRHRRDVEVSETARCGRDARAPIQRKPRGFSQVRFSNQFTAVSQKQKPRHHSVDVTAVTWRCRKPRGAGGTPALPGEQNSVQQSVHSGQPKPNSRKPVRPPNQHPATGKRQDGISKRATGHSKPRASVEYVGATGRSPLRIPRIDRRTADGAARQSINTAVPLTETISMLPPPTTS